jgi:hypothetical protein
MRSLEEQCQKRQIRRQEQKQKAAGIETPHRPHNYAVSTLPIQSRLAVISLYTSPFPCFLLL